MTPPIDLAPAPRLTEAQIRTAAASANVPALLMLVFQATGDERWLRDPYRPTRGKGLGDHDSGGLPEDVQAEIREAAVAAIVDLQEGKPPAIEFPSPELTIEMMSICMGEPVGAEYGGMLSEGIATRIDPHVAEQAMPTSPQTHGLSVVVIGAGLAGIAATHQLEAMGADYVVIEKQPEAGGNWWQTVYPGAGVDTPSHLYSYSFARNDWGQHFELRDRIQEYFAEVVDRLGATDRVRYDTEVLRAVYDEDAMVWRTTIRTSSGAEEVLESTILISAVGVLNRPKLPAVPGVGTFAGPEFHSAEWPPGLDLDGKRVAVVGNGASAMQIVPAIAGRVGHLTVFQRSTQWVAPFEKFMTPIGPELRQLLESCPIYFAWYWARLFWQFGDKVIEALRVDPEWEHPERSVNARNDAHRAYFTRYIETFLADRPDLMEKVVPTYPPYGKRILLDNGWYDALKRDNVTLVPEGVTAVTEAGVTTESGTTHEDIDVLVWATGFDVARFLASFEVVGRGGQTIREAWDDDNPRAYLGVAVPGFPNLFMLGGPNTFPGSGSFTYFNEIQMQYIRRLVTQMVDDGLHEIEVDETTFEEYNDAVDRTHAAMVWTHPGTSSNWRNAEGRVVYLNPFLNVEFWQMTRTSDLGDFVGRRREASRS
ncbi:NAD(P)/FAD-dependent oxidoreductase [Aeromicrobium sp.]|uniref:flavin-containing monooxygenase n=1 Tax=Aeromicrobium sp. TaxID=1871063 RepID=UPI0025BE46CC|nr:NAD(P)/FAD-dependent oxidoreductase [Aeromicrobium sp.]MCK5892593.1 NAD(P)/FAD-dependent oxidoreductase [Aeromicrobium sp.]